MSRPLAARRYSLGGLSLPPSTAVTEAGRVL